MPPATGNNAVITVKVGSDRSGTAGVTSLAGAVLGLFDTATGTTPVATFGTCTSDVDGDCSFTVPNTQAGGANRDRRFFVKQISSPTGYYTNTTLAVGTTVASTSYAFQTGTQLRNGTIYRSTVDFMIDTGNDEQPRVRRHLAGQPQQSDVAAAVRYSRGNRRRPVELGGCTTCPISRARPRPS